MNIKKIKIFNPFNGLDGTCVYVEPKRYKIPNKNEYFLGFIGIGLGFASIFFAIFYYADLADGLVLTTESWIFLFLGVVFLVFGTIFVTIAAVYLLTLEQFLHTADFTKCNIKCYVENRKVGNKHDWYYQSYYTLIICYIDKKGHERTKILRWLLAYKYYEALRRDFVSDPPFESLENVCIAAYNGKGKVIVLYK